MKGRVRVRLRLWALMSGMALGALGFWVPLYPYSMTASAWAAIGEFVRGGIQSNEPLVFFKYLTWWFLLTSVPSAIFGWVMHDLVLAIDSALMRVWKPQGPGGGEGPRPAA